MGFSDDEDAQEDIGLPYDQMPVEVRRRNWGWFGDPWPSGICYKQDPETGSDLIPYQWDFDMQVETPVGSVCVYCDEAIVEGDRGQLSPYLNAEGHVSITANHRECSFRAVMGPLAHQEKRCRCFGGTDHDTPGLTRRQEAVAVWDSFVRPIR